MAYIIMTAEEKPTVEEEEYQIQIEDFAHKLRERWVGIKIQAQTFPGDTYLLNWDIPIEDYRLLGGIQDDRRIITVENFPEGAAQFAAWYRSITPSKYRLFISHDSEGYQRELVPNMTANEVFQMLDED